MTFEDMFIGACIASFRLGPGELVGGSDHDVFWLCRDSEKFTPEDRAMLEKHGWRVGEQGYWESGT